jgi:hypothetical protein
MITSRATKRNFPENSRSSVTAQPVASTSGLKGNVTQSEVAAHAAARILGNFDENDDGALTADEVPGPMWERLMAADADENGSVSEAEIRSTILKAPRRGGPPAESERRERPRLPVEVCAVPYPIGRSRWCCWLSLVQALLWG